MAVDVAVERRRGGRPAQWSEPADAGPVVDWDERPASGRAGAGAGAPRRPRPVVCAGAHPGDLHGSKLTPRGRVAVALAWVVLIALAVLMVMTLPGGEAPAPTMKVMVEPGVTLWDLAGAGADREETVATIMSLNDLEAAEQIRPGDILVIPVEP